MRDEVTRRLADAHAVEQETRALLRAACEAAGPDAVGEIFAEHARSAEGHEERLHARLKALDGSPARMNDIVMTVAGAGLGRAAGRRPDAAARLLALDYAGAHLALATYELLRLAAERDDDPETAALARDLGDDERAIADRLLSAVDEALDPDEGLEDLLIDLHAVEAQNSALLDRARHITGGNGLGRMYGEQLELASGHVELLEKRLHKLEKQPSRLEDGTLRLGAMNLAAYLEAQPNTAEKLAALAFAAEHLEIALYTQLIRVADQCDDDETRAMAENILGEERAAADRIAASLPELLH